MGNSFAWCSLRDSSTSRCRGSKGLVDIFFTKLFRPANHQLTENVPLLLGSGVKPASTLEASIYTTPSDHCSVIPELNFDVATDFSLASVQNKNSRSSKTCERFAPSTHYYSLYQWITLSSAGPFRCAHIDHVEGALSLITRQYALGVGKLSPTYLL